MSAALEERAEELIREFKRSKGLPEGRGIDLEEELVLLSQNDLASVALRPGALASLHEHEHVMTDWEVARLAKEEADRVQRLFHERHDQKPQAPKVQPLTPGANVLPALGTSYIPKPQERDSWTCADLLKATFPEPRWTVPELLPTGLAVLAGLPKRGKSFMALALGVAVSSGGAFLNKHLDRGTVIYVALEDSPRRLKDRLEKMRAPATCDLSFEFDWPALDRNGMAQLRKLIEEREPKLVILDTLTRCFSSRVDWNKAGDTTGCLAELQRLALDHDVTVLLIDHLRKGSSVEGDSIQDVAGSIAKTACVDTLWTLHKKRGERGATLLCIGRDLADDMELRLFFDRATCAWQMAENALSQPQQEVIEAVGTLKRATCQQVALAVGRNKGTVYRSLQDLVNEGYLIQEGESYISRNDDVEQPGQPEQPEQPKSNRL